MLNYMFGVHEKEGFFYRLLHLQKKAEIEKMNIFAGFLKGVSPLRDGIS